MFSSVAQSCPTFWNPMDYSMSGFLPITNSQSLLKLMSIELVMPSNHFILCHPLLLLPSIFTSIRVFASKSVLHIRWPNIGVSASASVLPMNIQDWFPLGLTGWISLQSKGLSRVFSNTTVQKHQFFSAQLSLYSNSDIHTWLRTFVGKVMSLLFNMLSRLLPRSQVSFYFMAAVTICNDFKAQENKVCHCFHCFPIYLPWSDGTRCHDNCWLNVEF